LAEYTEIRHVPASLNRSSKSPKFNPENFPKEFTLNKGHVSFFFDKGEYIHSRFLSIQAEMEKRGFNLSPEKKHLNMEPYYRLHLYFGNDWKPSAPDYVTILTRIKERIEQKPHLYPDKERTYTLLEAYDLI
jgi:deoxyribonuclease (pyrimidine dimer)